MPVQFYGWKVWLRMLRTDVTVKAGEAYCLRTDEAGCEVLARAYTKGLAPKLDALAFHWEESRFITLAGPVQGAMELYQGQKAA